MGGVIILPEVFWCRKYIFKGVFFRKIVNGFQQKTSSYMFDRVLNTAMIARRWNKR